MFYSLKDSQEERKEKKLFYKSKVDSRWTFKDELQEYLNSKANALLSAILKIITNCYNIQICLRKEFPTQKMSPNSSTIKYGSVFPGIISTGILPCGK